MTSPIVAVIGSGMAAVGFCATLKDLLPDVTIYCLEARDRIGGRLHSAVQPDGNKLDLGGSWIHGLNGNPLVDLAQKAGSELAPIDNDDMRGVVAFYMMHSLQTSGFAQSLFSMKMVRT